MASQESLDKLNQRVESLEKELSSIKNELKQFSSSKKEAKVIPSEYKPEIITPKLSAPSKPKVPSRNFDWEVLLGGNILGKLGLAAILLACIWFIKYAFDNHWINESGRIFIGLVIGFFSIITGLFLAKQKMRIVPESLIGTGVSIIYISLYGAYYFYNLLEVKEAFAAFTILTVGTSLLAGKTNLQILYIFSLFGSIFSPILLSSGENSYRFLFTYLTLINLIFYYISKTNNWRVSPFLVFFSNCIIFTVWADNKLIVSSPIPPILYLTSLFLILGMREIYLMPRLRKTIVVSSMVLFLLLVISYSGLGYFVVHRFYENLTSHFLLLHAFILVGFLKISEHYSLPALETNPNAKKSLSGVIFLAWIAILFSAVSDFSQGRWITLSWILFAGGLSVLGSYFRNKIYLLLSTIPWFLALLRLYFVESLYDNQLYFLFNTRFGMFTLAACFLLFTYQIQKKNSIHKSLVGYVFTALFTLILGTLVEAHYAISDPYYRNLGYSYVIAFYMIALLIPGFKYSFRSFRLTGIILGLLLVSKFYLYDIWMMGVVVRIIAGFSLGIGLVVLSIVYQKYKDKINVNQILKLTAFPLLLFTILFTEKLSAEPFKNNGYKYYTDVQGLSKELIENENLIYGRLRLTEEISKFHGTSDLRLVYNKELVPFFQRKAIKVTGNTGKTTPVVVYTNVTSNGRTYILKFEEPPAKTEYTEIGIAGSERYETGVYISLGDEPNHWQESTSALIYNYYDEQAGKVNRIKFQSGKYRYARLEFDSKLKFDFTSAIYTPIIEKAEYKVDLKLEDLIKSTDSDRKATAYYYDNPLHKPISRVVLNFEDPKYQRSIEFFQKELSSKEYTEMAETRISKKPNFKAEHNITFPNYQGGNIKFLIVDNDDKPLTLKSIEAYSEIEELVFEIPRTSVIDDSTPFLLYYGNQYAQFPTFDIQSHYEDKYKHANFKIGGHKLNPDFSYSMVEPPLSSWIIRGIFIFGLIGMAYPAFSILKKYRAELDIDTEKTST